MDTTSVYLPDDVIELILSKCPVKSIVRFKSVSKSWQSIICDPRFSRILESKLSKNQNKFLFWMRQTSDSGYPLYLIKEDGKFRRESVSGYPSPDFVPLSSCKGLFLLGNLQRQDYMLWNPLIKKDIIIPAFKKHTSLPLCHLYFDSITDDYKIVFVHEPCYAVYSCKNGSWDIKDLPPERWIACVDGCLYRTIFDDEVICFDTRDGKLHNFPQPEEVEYLNLATLMVVSGRLCLYGRYSSLGGDGLHLWAMEENGNSEKRWRKLLSMAIEKPNNLWSRIPVCLSNEDDVVVEGEVPKNGRYKQYVCNSHRNCNFQEIDFDSTGHYTTRYIPYSESLYLPSSNVLA